MSSLAMFLASCSARATPENSALATKSLPSDSRASKLRQSASSSSSANMQQIFLQNFGITGSRWYSCLKTWLIVTKRIQRLLYFIPYLTIHLIQLMIPVSWRHYLANFGVGQNMFRCFAKIFCSSAKCTWKGPVASREPRDGLRGSDSSSVCGSRAKRLQIRRFDVWKSCKTRNFGKWPFFLAPNSRRSYLKRNLSGHKMRTEGFTGGLTKTWMQRLEVSSAICFHRGKFSISDHLRPGEKQANAPGPLVWVELWSRRLCQAIHALPNRQVL